MNKLNKLYETLTNDERLKLFLHALARNDERELDLLDDSCPHKSYRMIDYKFTTKKVDTLVMTAYQALESYQCLTLAMAALIVMLTHDDKADENDNVSYGSAESAFNAAISLFKGKEEAWKQFCDDVGLDAELTRKGFKIDIPWNEDGVCYFLDSLSKDINPNEKVLINSKSQLHAIYER